MPLYDPGHGCASKATRLYLPVAVDLGEERTRFGGRGLNPGLQRTHRASVRVGDERNTKLAALAFLVGLGTAKRHHDAIDGELRVGDVEPA
jgi:hypothetical protein